MLHSKGKNHSFSDDLYIIRLGTYFGCCMGRFKRWRKHWTSNPKVFREIVVTTLRNTCGTNILEGEGGNRLRLIATTVG